MGRLLARITKSKIFKTPSNDSRKLTKIVIALFVFAFILGTVILITYIYNVNINFIIFFAISCFFILIAAINIGSLKTEKNKKDYIYNSLLNTYNDIQILPLPMEKIIHGDKTKIGHIRNSYNFSAKIPKYHCILTNYYQERLEMISSHRIRRNSYYFSYVRFKNVFEYLYNLNHLDLTSLSNNILKHENLKKVINEISQSKLINISIENDCLIIRKETVLYDYQEEDAIRDVSDIEFFYDKIIKILSDNDIEILEITNDVDSKEKEIENDYENHYNHSLLHSFFTPQNKSLFTFIIGTIFSHIYTPFSYSLYH